MKNSLSKTLLLLAFLALFAPSGARAAGQDFVTIDLTSFGAAGDGVTDDGPALQSALDALALAGGGTLNVPAGRYAIQTPVLKDFSGSGAAVRIQGVPSLTPVNPFGTGQELTTGLDLTSEFVVRTGGEANALTLVGLDSLLLSDLVFIGTPDAVSDARITLALYDIDEATVSHCEFYGLSTHDAGGAVIHADRSRLTIERTVFLGCAANSSLNVPLILNTTWRAVTVSEAIFADYGQRPDFYGKLGQGTPFSWVTLGNPAPVDNLSPRREAIVKNVFLDEGALHAIASTPDRYDPAAQLSDLIYISGLRVNVSSADGAGITVIRARRVMVEDAWFGLSTSAAAAVDLYDAGEVVLDRLDCLASAADRIRADAATKSVTVIDSLYNHLESEAQRTRVITPAAPADDPVRDVRAQFDAALGRAPDPAAHFYWPERLLGCEEDEACVSAVRFALSNYLAANPSPVFSVSGTVTDESGEGFADVSVSLSGSQQVSTVTDAAGAYRFDGLPTSGDYELTPSFAHHNFGPAAFPFSLPAADLDADFAAARNLYRLGGRVRTSAGTPVAGATVTLSGTQSGTSTTDQNGDYSFDVPAEGDYTLKPSKTHYTFSPASSSFNALPAARTADFNATLLNYAIRGRATLGGSALAGVTVRLSGTSAGTTRTDASGNYSFTAPGGGTYTVTPSLPGHGFSPASRAVADLAGDKTAQDFAASSTATAAETVWVDDSLPAGAVEQSNGDTWEWVASSPAPQSGSWAHRSAAASGFHNHYFHTATQTLPLADGDGLYAYVYLDPVNVPTELMLQWHDGTQWRNAYWGSDQINWVGTRVRMGDVPAAGMWVKLSVPAETLGLEGKTLTGMAFNLWGGGATWDRAGRESLDEVWFDDAPPAGAVRFSNGDAWTWVSSSPSPFSGTLAHQSVVATGFHNHYFQSATRTLTPAAGEALYAYVYLDPANVPTELMLQWHDGSTWKNAYWGEDRINWVGTRVRMGDVPAAGQWVRLEVPAASLGLEGKTLRGMAFNLWGGRATWDRAGKGQVSPEAEPPSPDTVWVDDSLPAGAESSANGEAWTWVSTNPAPFSGASAHQSATAAGFHNHYFQSAADALQVGEGDVLYAYVYIDPANVPAELMIQWKEGATWKNAYWGSDQINWVGARVRIGDVPAAGQWVKLEVPASTLGLEGKTLTGMAFNLWGGKVTWDRAGKVSP